MGFGVRVVMETPFGLRPPSMRHMECAVNMPAFQRFKTRRAWLVEGCSNLGSVAFDRRSPWGRSTELPGHA